MQKAPSVYDPRIAAIIAIAYSVIVTLLWGSKTLAHYRFARSNGRMPSDEQTPATKAGGYL